jgi:iron complex outermembrane receptor protein
VLNTSYTYLNRNIDYKFGSLAGVSAANTSINVLAPLPKNKFVGTATLRTFRQVQAIANFRYEGGLTVQDTTYAANSPQFLPYREAFATVDLGFVAPVWKGALMQAGVKNVLDRYYYYNPGYPEAGRNWYTNVRYTF